MGGRPRGRRSGRGRLVIVALVVLVAWFGVGVRLFQLQIVQAADLKEMGLEQRTRVKVLAAERGTIYDRDGRELAITVQGRTIGADTDQLQQPTQVAELLAVTLGIDQAQVLETLQSGRRWVTVARQIDAETAAQVERLELPGIYSYPEAMRVYPEGSLAAQVLGFVDPDGNGLEGLEYRYDEQLSGTPGEVRFEQDLEGNVIPQGRYDLRPAIPGSDLVTTIDRDIEFIAERECKATLERTEAKRCTVVVLDPSTGEVLAMVVVPGFDPNDRSASNPDDWVNWAVLGTYEPGSAEKLITIAAALEERAVNAATTFEVPDVIEVVDGACEGRFSAAGDQINGCYHDAERHPIETLSVRDIVTRSSNVGTILIGQRLGDSNLARYIDAFGLGRKTGIDVPGESPGRLNLDPTCPSCFASAAIGYAVSVTPLQMAAAYGAVANDGVWVQPHLVRELVDGSGVQRPISPEERRVVSAETALVMRSLLRNVVESSEGTGGKARIPGYTAAGKTGTARKFVPGEGYTDDYVVSFVGMAPASNPRIVVAVVVDSPRIGSSGGRVAAPAFSKIAEDTLHRLGVPPDAP
ncbi:stage V sporulation protein D [bacterium BMS3Abin02]|nr:stage V sporulation protein D [bacterium BMS3Abin02]GBE21325.1 stage V sporulation protein D [bacterium BMS3Bbin01]HDH24751.1 penicillin-binding protein 2 [Actinomycetota bacterium]HDL49126.1 penicillin-binding protein 2 [Actinomycetota bacterium]